MSRRKEYISVERERIAELISKIDDLWILGQIYKFVAGMKKEN